MPKLASVEDLTRFREQAQRDIELRTELGTTIYIGMGTCGSGNGAEGVYHAFADEIDRRGMDIVLARVGCFGFCAEEPLVASLGARRRT